MFADNDFLDWLSSRHRARSSRPSLHPERSHSRLLHPSVSSLYLHVYVLLCFVDIYDDFVFCLFFSHCIVIISDVEFLGLFVLHLCFNLSSVLLHFVFCLYSDAVCTCLMKGGVKETFCLLNVCLSFFAVDNMSSVHITCYL